jgi:hypothetical protein
MVCDFTYVDCEGDLITITCDADVLEGITSALPAPTFKINLTLVTDWKRINPNHIVQFSSTEAPN